MMNRKFKRALSLLLVSVLLLPTGLVAPAALADSEVVFHETFESGLGVAVPAGDVSLTPVSDVVFAGNDDGHAVYVSGRTQGWNGVDIPFSSVGMEDGKTYTVTAAVYVDSDVTVPDGAKALLQNVDSYNGLYVEAAYEAGQALTLSGTYTVDTSKDRALRIQSNDSGAEVPFYIGDILIMEKESGGSEEPEGPRDPALPFTTIDFEDGTAGGFEARGGTEVLTVTDEANHTEGGTKALKVEGRSETWHGPSLRVEKYIDRGHEYSISAWVKLISPSSAQIQLSTQIGNGDGASYNNLQGKTISTADGWVKFEGTYRYDSVGGEYVTIYVESSNNAEASFYIDDIRFEPTGSETIDIERDLIPIKDVYADDFLIGNAVSAKDLEGIRLELLKMHHNLVTAENAMKPGYAYDDEGNFDFTAEDELVEKIREEGLLLHGHVLVWHQQSNESLHTDEDGKPLSREVALANLRLHVQTAVEHFGDNVISWDVVNEAMNDNPPNPEDWRASLRQSGWYHAIGPDYIEEAFKAAKEVLKDNGWDHIKLYYNDYNDDNQNKAEAIYQMVKEINENYAAEHDGELLIDGIGMQGHYNINTRVENVRRSMEKFISLGVEVGVTELDITAGTDHVLTEEQANKQAYLYAQLFQLYKEHAEHISRVTFWGLDDATSWRAAQSPLVFDRSLQAKPAYYAIIDPEKFIEQYDPEEIEASQATAAYGTPIIDGEVDALWSKTELIPIERYQTAWQGASGTARVLWDEQHLYVLIEVSDEQLDKSNVNEWEQDSIEIFLDQNNAKTTSYDDDDGQYRVNFDNETSFNPPSIAEGFESATYVDGTNYTVEVKIPLDAITPSVGTKLGFDVQINDAKDGARQSVAAWNDTTGTGYQDPSVFGILTLITEETPDDDDEDEQQDRSRSRGRGSGSSSSDRGQGADGAVTITPQVKTADGHLAASISAASLRTALARIESDDNRSVVVDLTERAGAESYELVLPVSALDGQESFVLSVQTEAGFVDIPSGLLASMTEGAEQVAIHIAAASADDLAADIRAEIGDRPVIELHLSVDGERVAWHNPDTPVTVAIPYTPLAIEALRPDQIVIWYIDGEGNVIAVPNGRYDAASGTVIFSTTHFSTFAVAYVDQSFADLHEAAWAEHAVSVMSARDVVQGTSEGVFSPAAEVTRAQFAALLVRVLELHGTGDDEAMFTDVAASAPYYDELAVAKQLGIVDESADGSFRPDQPITRQDMMVMVVRALAAAGKAADSSGTFDADRFTDAGDISDYAYDSVAELVASGIIVGKNGRIAPLDVLTRAEAAVILYRIWDL